MNQLALPALAAGDACLSACGTYRYRLRRGAAPHLGFVMLNPSTADATADDPTIARCCGFARREGLGGIDVVNLYAYRSTVPAALHQVRDPVGPDNDPWLVHFAKWHRRIVCAWGAGAPDEERVLEVTQLLAHYGAQLLCLGVTKDGSPRHPLYVKADQPLTPWRPLRAAAA